MRRGYIGMKGRCGDNDGLSCLIIGRSSFIVINLASNIDCHVAGKLARGILHQEKIFSSG